MDPTTITLLAVRYAGLCFINMVANISLAIVWDRGFGFDFARNSTVHILPVAAGDFRSQTRGLESHATDYHCSNHPHCEGLLLPSTFGLPMDYPLSPFDSESTPLPGVYHQSVLEGEHDVAEPAPHSMYSEYALGCANSTENTTDASKDPYIYESKEQSFMKLVPLSYISVSLILGASGSLIYSSGVFLTLNSSVFLTYGTSVSLMYSVSMSLTLGSSVSFTYSTSIFLTLGTGVSLTLGTSISLTLSAGVSFILCTSVSLTFSTHISLISGASISFTLGTSVSLTPSASISLILGAGVSLTLGASISTPFADLPMLDLMDITSMATPITHGSDYYWDSIAQASALWPDSVSFDSNNLPYTFVSMQNLGSISSGNSTVLYILLILYNVFHRTTYLVHQMA